MNTRTNPDDILAAWLDENTVPLPAPTRRAIEIGIRTIHQRRRPIWSPRRIEPMSSAVSRPAVRGFAAMAAIVVVVAIGVFALFGPRFGVGPPAPPHITAPPPPTQSAPPSAVPTLALYPPAGGRAGTYSQKPFGPGTGNGLCLTPPQSGCAESAADDSIRVTFTVPDGWRGGISGVWRVEGTGPPSGAAVIFQRGGWVYDQPCAAGDPNPTISTGTTVDEFVSALVEHPDLDVTDPVDVTLAGHSGKYLELRAPATIVDGGAEPGPDQCGFYFVWQPGIYAQGPNQLWRLWVVDVAGTRVVVRADSFPENPASTLTEQQSIVDSIQIEP